MASIRLQVEARVTQKRFRSIFLRIPRTLSNPASVNVLHWLCRIGFEGEITQYRIIPIAATAEQTAAENRLTVAVRVRYYNRLNEEDNFEQTFSFYSDYDGSLQLTGSVLDTAYEDIFERITQDIFNAAVAKW